MKKLGKKGKNYYPSSRRKENQQEIEVNEVITVAKDRSELRGLKRMGMRHQNQKKLKNYKVNMGSGFVLAAEAGRV